MHVNARGNRLTEARARARHNDERCMSIALRARTTGALVGFVVASAVVADIRVANARSTRGVCDSLAREASATSSAAGGFGRTDGSAAVEASERGELVLGRAFRREVGRGWNAAVDGVFGAGVRALSDRGL